jgi:hypothetical protein
MKFLSTQFFSITVTSPIRLNILLSNLFSNILTERYFCNAGKQVSYPGKIILAIRSLVKKDGRFKGLYLLVYCTYSTINVIDVEHIQCIIRLHQKKKHTICRKRQTFP